MTDKNEDIFCILIVASKRVIRVKELHAGDRDRLQRKYVLRSSSFSESPRMQAAAAAAAAA